MFEDFKQKILEYNKDNQKPLLGTLSPEAFEPCRKQGIAPDNVTMQQLF
jgi:hypothetical protein